MTYHITNRKILKDLKGQRSGRLTVLSRAENDKHGNVRWNCRCDCGVVKIIYGGSLRCGKTKSCGCLHREAVRLHGHSVGAQTPTYNSWCRMVQRCTDPKRHNFKHYGGRGISICERWRGKDGFSNFLADMGERPAGLTLDRYPDNNGDYEPGNCRWATTSQQSKNRRPAKEKTHCNRGHPFSPENTLTERGARRCRTCRLSSRRERRDKVAPR